jgi:hypothetical protein
MRSKPATRENNPIRAVVLEALTTVPLVALITAVVAPPAGAQTAISTSGDVGSAASRSGYPAGGGAIVLPALGGPTAATGTAAATGAGDTTTTTSGGASGSSASGSGSSGGRSRTSTASAGGVAPSAGTGSGAHWVMCPPTGSSGLLTLFTGTDLSCTTD